jgi:hypothetical protein
MCPVIEPKFLTCRLPPHTITSNLYCMTIKISMSQVDSGQAVIIYHATQFAEDNHHVQ